MMEPIYIIYDVVDNLLLPRPVFAQSLDDVKAILKLNQEREGTTEIHVYQYVYNGRSLVTKP